MEKAKNEEFTVYLSLDASTMVTSKQVHIEDIASVFCSKPDVMHAVKKIKLYTFHDNEQEQIVIHTLAIIAEILKYDTSVTIQNIGSEACVVYYRNLSDAHKRSGKIKAAFLMLLAFFGTAYSIMSYNGDVGAISLLKDRWIPGTNSASYFIVPVSSSVCSFSSTTVSITNKQMIRLHCKCRCACMNRMSMMRSS